MEPVTQRLLELGRAVSDASDRMGSANTLELARRRWDEMPRARPAPPKPRVARGWIVAAATLAAAIAAVALVVLRPEPGLAFVVGPNGTRGIVGDWIAAGERSELLVRFEEGTTFKLSPGARVRVTETTDHGASVLIERGGVHVDVVHVDDRTEWNVLAGPYTVRVVGTAFRASWDPVTESFDLAMEHGEIIASGPLLRDGGRSLVDGERLRVAFRERRVTYEARAPEQPGAAAQAKATALANEASVSSASTANEASASTANEASAGASASVPSAAATQSASAVPAIATAQAGGATAGAASPIAPINTAPPNFATTERPAGQSTSFFAASAGSTGWRALAARGAYREALEAVERAGFAAELERASAADLAVLADVARFAGKPDRAREALLVSRRRFGANGTNAFLLGKIAADQQKMPGEAVAWFETYLSEQPEGPLAEQALGRILELKRHGDPAGARAAAERYLARYPQGPHAPLARSIVGR